MLPTLQQVSSLQATMLPSVKMYEKFLDGLMPAFTVNEMLGRALQVNVPQVGVMSGMLADLVRFDVGSMLPKLDFAPARLVLPHLDGMFAAARIANEVSGLHAAALAAARTLEDAYARDLDEELEELLRDSDLLAGEEREQAVEDAARAAELAEQTGASTIDIQQVIAWLGTKLAQAKDLWTAERITLIITVLMALGQAAQIAMQVADQGKVEAKLVEVGNKVDELKDEQRETNEILRGIEGLLERRACDDTDDDCSNRGEG